MKKVISLAAALALTIGLLAGCGPKEPQQPQGGNEGGDTLVVYTARSESLNNAVIENFEKDTGIKVEVVTGGTGEILKRVQSEASNPQGDICWAADGPQLRGYVDYFENYVSPSDAGMMEGYKNTSGYSAPAFCDPPVFIVNTDLAGDIEINGFADLLNPALKGKIAFCDPAASSSAFEHLVNMLYAMGGGDTEEGWDYVRKFCEQLDGKMLGGSSAVYKGVADGEYTVGLTFEQGSAQYVGAGAPVKTVYMEEGVIFRGDGVYIIKDCPNMKSAQIFLDWLTSKEVQEFMNNTQYRRTIRKDVESGDAMVPMEDINVIKDDETNTAEHKAEWLDKFKDIFTQ